MLRFSSYAFRVKRMFSAQYFPSRCCSTVPTVKVLSTTDDDFLKISFRYGNVPHVQTINFKAAKEQHIKEALSQIKLMVILYRNRSKMRQVVMNKYATVGSTENQVVLESEDEFEINLLNGKSEIDDLRNVDAWTSGSSLKIGESVYQVNHNMPTVLQLTIPGHILAGCCIRPHIVLECASVEDCQFLWYRGNQENDEWNIVSEGFVYMTSPEDIGCKLKLACLPKVGDLTGTSFVTISENVVEEGPASFPFQDRQAYTKDLVDSDCIRCVSYNVLANCYVDMKKFPYSSRKAKDIYYRKQLLIKEILGYNSDIICMQEVQERVFDFDFLPVLTKFDFDGFYVRKGGRRYEGLAVFYRNTKFRVIEERGMLLNQIVKDKQVATDLLLKVSGNYKVISDLLAQDTALSVVLLEHTDNPHYRVLVANTHLYSNKDKPQVRLIQAALCTQYIEHFLKTVEDNSCFTSVLFCGDFNSLPDSAAYEFLLNGSFQCSSSWKNNSVAEDSDMILRTNLNLQSACGTPKYTNYTEEFSGCLDYILFNQDHLNVSEVVPMPSHDDVTSNVALPSELFPSDHLALVCTLKWNHWKN